MSDDLKNDPKAEAADEGFWRAAFQFRNAAVDAGPVSAAEIATLEEAAAAAFDYATRTRDPVAWGMLLGGLAEYVAREIPLPGAALRGIAKLLLDGRDAGSVDELMGFRSSGGRKRSLLIERDLESVNVKLVLRFMATPEMAGRKRMSLEDAFAAVVAFRQGAVSETTVKRQYQKFVRSVKAKQNS